jgi:membrane-bound metal-dependent hydrolase YbcI (DUF457 family)
MAGFRMHISTSTVCGMAFGAASYQLLGHDPQTAVLAAGVTAVGGMLPDLDSDSGVPVREMSAFSAAVIPMLALPRLEHSGISTEGIFAIMGLAYFLVRFGGAWFVRTISVHRGMFHSVPAMLISGLVVYLAYDSPVRSIRLLLATGIMIGFFSHLLLDEIYAVDFNGIRIKLNGFAGSAIKFVSTSFLATTVCYLILGGLMWAAYHDYEHPLTPGKFEMKMPSGEKLNRLVARS